MKTDNRFARPAAYVPHMRTPYQDHVAMQRRMVWVERLAKFAVGLVALLAVLGHVGR